MEQLGDKRLLKTLEKLEQEAKRFAKRMKAQETDDGKVRIDELHKRVDELERLKRDLVCQASITTMAEKVVTSGSGARDSRMDNPVSNRLPTPEELRHSYEERKFEAFLQAFRLTGVSMIKCDSRTLLIELLTSHEGRFYEAYYIEITDIEENNKTLSHHTIPYFIPVQSYFDSYLAGKLHFHGFLLPIIKELNGFVSRRQQALRVESVHKKYLKENVATMSYDLIQLVTNEFDVVELKVKFWYVVRLLYDNQSAIRPTKVRCRVQFAEKSQEIDFIKDIKMCYKNYEITEAFTKVIEIACETSQISTSSSHATSSSSNDSTKVNDSSKVNNSKVNNTQ